MSALSTLALLAALTAPGFADAIAPGFYVDQTQPCEAAPAPAVLSFDGTSYISGQVACTPTQPITASGQVTAACVEDNDQSTREDQQWDYQVLSEKSFSINGQTFRYCGPDSK